MDRLPSSKRNGDGNQTEKAEIDPKRNLEASVGPIRPKSETIANRRQDPDDNGPLEIAVCVAKRLGMGGSKKVSQDNWADR